MNNNEETRILNPQQNEQNTEVKSNATEPTKNKNAKATAATVGVGLGVAGTAAAEHIYAHATGEYSQEEAQVVDAQPEEPVLSVVQKEPETTTEYSEEIPQDAELVDESKEIQQPEAPEASTSTDGTGFQTHDDGEVHFVGVQAVETEDGDHMIMAALERDGDVAVVVDVDADGLMDVLVHDDNYDGQISENEIHDISDDHIMTAAVIDAYEQEQQMQYMASDDTPDYINDADTGVYEG